MPEKKKYNLGGIQGNGYPMGPHIQSHEKYNLSQERKQSNKRKEKETQEKKKEPLQLKAQVKRGWGGWLFQKPQSWHLIIHGNIFPLQPSRIFTTQVYTLPTV